MNRVQEKVKQAVFEALTEAEAEAGHGGRHMTFVLAGGPDVL